MKPTCCSNDMNRKIRVGTYGDSAETDYRRTISANYHRHRLNVVSSIVGPIDLRHKTCVDFGCGEGVYAEMLAQKGAHVICIDASEKMIAAAKARLDGIGTMSFHQGSVEQLSALPADSIDLVVSLNTIAYLTESEEKAFYEAVRFIVKPLGDLVVTHSNELFDLFTLNKFTVGFFKTNFDSDISRLITHDRLPGRGHLSIRENPLSYKHKLSRYGFQEIEQRFCNYHKHPPLLMDGFDPDDLDRTFVDTLQWDAHEQWKLLFQCSMFASHALKSI